MSECGDLCWGDGPYPDLADYGDVVSMPDLSGGEVYLGGGMFALLNSYVLTDPAPLERTNVMVPDRPGRYKKAAKVRSRSVDLEIKVSGLTDSYSNPVSTPPLIADPVAQVESNIDFLASITVENPANILGGVPIGIMRKSGARFVGYVQYSDMGAAPGRSSRLVTITATIVRGALQEI